MIYRLANDSTVPREHLPQHFIKWASRYYSPVSDISAIDESVVEERAAQEMASYTAEKSATAFPEDIASVADPDTFWRSCIVMYRVLPSVYWENSQRALFDNVEFLPEVDVLMIWCNRSPGTCLWGAKTLQDRLVAAQQSGKACRKMKFVKLDGANHMVGSHIWYVAHDLKGSVAVSLGRTRTDDTPLGRALVVSKS